MNTTDLVAMVEHWIATPKNAYFGQSYGQDLKTELLKNTNAFNADRLLAELKTDIPILAQLSSDQLGIVVRHGVDTHGNDVGRFDSVGVYIQLFNRYIEIT